MAKFKVGEKGRYIGQSCGRYAIHGREALVASIDCIHPKGDCNAMLVAARMAYPNEIIYGVYWVGYGDAGGYLPECELEKPLPQHQPNDLRVAEPQFIHGQLQRWLNPQKEKENVESN